MPASLTASVVINTYNRVDYLRRLIPALLRQRDVEFEIIVVNGPSTDGTEALLQRYANQVKVVSCSSRNLSHSRNLGIKASAGDVVVFIDDDALPVDEWWLYRFVKAFADSHPMPGALGGPVLIGDTDFYEFREGATSEYGIHIFNPSAQDASRVEMVRGVHGSNAAFLREVLVRIGGFDEFFIYYLDETDVCFRVRRSGYQIGYLHDNPVRHYAARARQPNKPRPWHLIAQSDTYFALKNARDHMFKRVLKTIFFMPKKHFVPEIVGDLRRTPFRSLPAAISSVGKGYLKGLFAGILKPRMLGTFPRRPPSFLRTQPHFSAPRLRIALLTETTPKRPGYGGIGRYTYDLALGLYERGHEVHIFCRDDRPIQREGLGFTIHGVVAPSSLPHSTSADRPVLEKNLAYSLAIVQRLQELHEQGVVFDVVHASNWNAEAVALIRSGMYPVVLMLVTSLAQIIQTEGWEQNDDLRACVALDRWQIEHATTVCVPSQGVIDSYRTFMGLDVATLPNLVRTPLGIVPDEAHLSASQSDRRKLLFVGRLEYRKGIHTLFAVLPDLLPQFPNWECHIVGSEGDGKLKQQFLDRYRSMPWIERVIFHGFVAEEDLRHHYRTCDLFVAPSLYESFGLIYHEAMQYGKPVVGCTTGGVPEVVEHGVEGLLVEPDQPSALRRAIERLMRNDDLRMRMGRAGRERVVQRQNYRTMAAHLEQVYYRVIAHVPVGS